MRSTTQALIIAIVFSFPAHGYAQTAPRSSRTPDAAQQLRRELDALKQQMQQMQDKILKQEELIQKLSTPAPPPPAAAPATTAALPSQSRSPRPAPRPRAPAFRQPNDQGFHAQADAYPFHRRCPFCSRKG